MSFLCLIKINDMSFLNLWNKSFMLDIQWNYHIENNYDFASANLEV